MKNPTLLITRPAPEGESLCKALQDLSISTVYFPTIEIQPVSINEEKIKDELINSDIIIFVSPNAVRYGAHLLTLDKSSVAAIGNSTALALEKQGIRASILPEKFNSAGLLNHPAFSQINSKKISIIRGVGGKELLANELTHRGAEVTYIEVYKRIKPKKLLTSLILDTIDWIIITSKESLKNLISMTPESLLSNLKNKLLLVSSNDLKEFAAQNNFQVLPYQLKSATQQDILNFFENLSK